MIRSLVAELRADAGSAMLPTALSTGVIAEWDRQHAEADEAREVLFGLSVDHAMRELDRLAQFEALTERLEPWLEHRDHGAGETIVVQGEQQEGMLLMTGGRAVVREEEAGARVAEYGPGDVLAAEAAFAPHVPAISVVAEAASRTALMTPASRRSLERDDLPLAVELDRYLIETMSANRAEPSSSNA